MNSKEEREENIMEISKINLKVHVNQPPSLHKLYPGYSNRKCFKPTLNLKTCTVAPYIKTKPKHDNDTDITDNERIDQENKKQN